MWLRYGYDWRLAKLGAVFDSTAFEIDASGERTVPASYFTSIADSPFDRIFAAKNRLSADEFDLIVIDGATLDFDEFAEAYPEIEPYEAGQQGETQV